ncbi:unnamed protein product [Psylliodes chrysocephalus]|uniref:Uncharacterized protein n=1 Tax=Psylliodes chrysocephalus TaxID=3402493 RepID=A0A9P0CWS6_9CUCU|nr:unnamed protein product [Psylliodes chrysocephala]
MPDVQTNPENLPSLDFLLENNSETTKPESLPNQLANTQTEIELDTTLNGESMNLPILDDLILQTQSEISHDCLPSNEETYLDTENLEEDLKPKEERTIGTKRRKVVQILEQGSESSDEENLEERTIGTKRRKVVEILEQGSESTDEENLEKKRCRITNKKEWSDKKNKMLREQRKAYKGWSRPKAISEESRSAHFSKNSGLK